MCYYFQELLQKHEQMYERVFQEDYVEGENDGKTQEDCLQKFSSRDYIMEPAIFNTLKT